MTLAGEKLFGQALRGGGYLLSFVVGQIALGDKAQRQIDYDAQPADAAGLVVNFSLTG